MTSEGVNNGMKRRNILSLFFLILLFVSIIPTTAFAIENIDPYQKLFNEDLGKGFKDGKPLFMRYSLINYRLDYTSGDQTSGGASTFLLINTILSFCMVGMALAAKLTIDIMTWAFSYNAIDLLIDNINDIVDRLVDGLFFSELFAIGLFVLGISLFFAFNKREDVAGKLTKVIFNLIIAFTLLTNMGTIIQYLNQISKWGSDIVFVAFESAVGSDVQEYDRTNKGKNAFLNVAEKFFEYNVHIPWQLSEFGHYVPLSKTNLTDEEQQVRAKTEEILSQDVRSGNQDEDSTGTSALDPAKFTNRFSSDNLADGQQENNTSISMSSFGIPFRIFVVWLTFIVGTLYGCLLLAIAGTAIICQFLMYLLAIVSPLVFLLIMVPEWGDQMLIKWLQGMITAAVYKILASFLLITILILQGKIYDVSQGWAYAMFAQVVLVFAVFLFRKNIMEYIPLPGVAAFQYAENTLFDKGKSIVDRTFGTVVDRAKVTVVGAPTTGFATGNPAMASQREAVNTAEHRESVQKSGGVVESLRSMMQSNNNTMQTKSEMKSDRENAQKERSQMSLRGATHTDSEKSRESNTLQYKRTSTASPEGFVRVGDVKEAIDRLAKTSTNSNLVKEQLEGKPFKAERKPVDVRVVEMTPLPHIIDQMADESVNKQKREAIDHEVIETNKRTVTPYVKEEKVEEKQVGRRRIPKLDFPELEEKEKSEEQINQQQTDNEELDPKRILEQQDLGANGQNDHKKDQHKKKKGGWLKKMVDKWKG